MARIPRIPFHFHALGHALSGEFIHPTRVLIDAQASASLPSIGGHAQAHAEGYFCQDFIRFNRAHTHVTGRWNEQRTEARTHAVTVIYDLNILDVVTAERVESNLRSVHRVGDPVGHITAGGSHFHNLRILGHPVVVKLRHNHLAECKNGPDFQKAVDSDKESGRMAEHEDGAALCSLVDTIETDLPDVNRLQHVIEVKGFGKIYLAEVFAAEGERTLTMIRLSLGSPHVAALTVAEANTNGQPAPPIPGGG
jgi:hypothetical protein